MPKAPAETRPEWPALPFALPKPGPGRRERATRLLAALDRAYPDAACRLDWSTPHELLVATILSAQATDESVNAATPALFRRFPTPAALAGAGADEIAPCIRTIGLWRNKARAVEESMRALVERHGGEVPRDMDALLALRGVARKTANVVLGTAFGIASGVTVDTHAFRVTQRWGWHAERTAEKVEPILMKAVPQAGWPDFGHRVVLFGRYTCTARAPKCAGCALAGLCPSVMG